MDRPFIILKFFYNESLAGIANDAALLAGFKDPFDPLTTISLDNKDYRFLGWSLMAGKLDWMLLRKCSVESKTVGNNDYSASDHKWMMANVTLS